MEERSSSWNFKAENSVHANFMMFPSPYYFITTYDIQYGQGISQK